LHDDLFIHMSPVQKQANFFIAPSLAMKKEVKLINRITEANFFIFFKKS
jgi:hypothetical protein